MDRMGWVFLALVGFAVFDIAYLIYVSYFKQTEFTHLQRTLIWGGYFLLALLFAWWASASAMPRTRWSTLGGRRRRPLA